MVTSSDLTSFWESLEVNFPLAGPRGCLVERIESELSALLEKGGLLTYVREDETYSCPQPGGPGCPRRVVHHSDDRISAVCGNDPPECEDIDLAAKDIEVLGVSPESLCEALRASLLFGGKTETVSSLNHVYRAGTFLSHPGVRKAIYFAARCSAKDYSILLDVLRSRHGAEGFALLVPTDRFVSEETIRESATRGIVVLPLAGIIGLNPLGQIVATVDTTKLFADIGRSGPGPVLVTDAVCVQVCFHNGWQNLDETAYRQLVQTADQYDIFADERTREVRKQEAAKGAARRKTRKVNSPAKSQASHFRMIRKAIEVQNYFDPNVDGPSEDHVAGKQTFQRARKVFDVKYVGPDGKANWKLLKTEKVDNHSVYRFQPDPEITFALIFLPRA